MIKCKNDGCPDGKNICCKICPDKADCNVACTDPPDTCGNSVHEGDSSTEMVAFESKAAAVIQSIVTIAKQKEKLDKQDKEMRSQLEVAMNEYGIKKFENDDISVTFVDATTRASVDSKKLKAKYPDVYMDCYTVSNVKASVRIKVK